MRCRARCSLQPRNCQPSSLNSPPLYIYICAAAAGLYLTKEKKLPTDHDKPKGAQSSYIFFCKAERARLKGTSPP